MQKLIEILFARGPLPDSAGCDECGSPLFGLDEDAQATPEEGAQRPQYRVLGSQNLCSDACWTTARDKQGLTGEPQPE